MRQNKRSLFLLTLVTAVVLASCGLGQSEAAEEEKGGILSSFGLAEDSVTVPQGTVLAVRTTTAISTKSHEAGDTFQATLEKPLVIEQKTVAPKGAVVTGKVAESDPGGRVKGRAYLAITLTELETAAGDRADIVTNTIGRQAPGSKKKDAAKIGIGSGVGAAIGAAAGGGKGAAVGAAAGAGAGTGAVLATRGKPAAFGSESVLQFRLEAPLSVATP